MQGTYGQLRQQYLVTRKQTLDICEYLNPEDFSAQAMADVSPPKWHLGHTTWFFETLLLKAFFPNYKPYDTEFTYLFNSYYNSLGKQFDRASRGLMLRPTLEEVMAYRQYVDENVLELLSSGKNESDVYKVLEIGIHHEQQHQELLITDIKHNYFHSPFFPHFPLSTIPQSNKPETASPAKGSWFRIEEGVQQIGHDDPSFAYDNETPQHKVYLQPFEIYSQLVTNEDYLEFVEGDGYKNPEYWLSEGWSFVNKNQINAPLYWVKNKSQWEQYTLHGVTALKKDEPVCHISFYEAHAYANYRKARLPTEFEWEHCNNELPGKEGVFADSQHFHPYAVETDSSAFNQAMGSVWEWTGSAYLPYPGYKPYLGALGEYNGKFMINQMVLRGGSCATVKSHIRPTYRNFFYPKDRWQFSGVRLARDI